MKDQYAPNRQAQFGRNDLPPLGQVLRERRESLGLTQRELARAAMISVRALGHIEAGRSGPSLLAVVRIADALRISIGDLVAAARAYGRSAVHTSAGSCADDVVDLTRDLHEPRMRATMMRISGNSARVPTADQRADSSFGMVLDGVVTVALGGGQNVRLIEGDAYHARPGADGGWSGEAGQPARLLHIGMRDREDI